MPGRGPPTPGLMGPDAGGGSVAGTSRIERKRAIKKSDAPSRRRPTRRQGSGEVAMSHTLSRRHFKRLVPAPPRPKYRPWDLCHLGMAMWGRAWPARPRLCGARAGAECRAASHFERARNYLVPKKATAFLLSRPRVPPIRSPPALTTRGAAFPPPFHGEGGREGGPQGAPPAADEAASKKNTDYYLFLFSSLPSPPPHAPGWGCPGR